jgi:hypothetical protein
MFSKKLNKYMGNGENYTGNVNTTISGRTCQKWSSTIPHEHQLTEVGDHNYCRNPDKDSGVWCYTTDPTVRYENCKVPDCAEEMINVIDLSADNDDDLDSNGEMTHASMMQDPKQSLPPAFTVCIAFMVEAWLEWYDGEIFPWAGHMFNTLGADGEEWLNIGLTSEPTYTDWDITVGSNYFTVPHKAPWDSEGTVAARSSLLVFTKQIRLYLAEYYKE